MPKQVTIYHNPRCTKSCQTLKLLQEQGLEPKIIEYLAVNLTSNVRELEGALTRILAQVLLTHTEPTLDIAKKVVREIGRPITQRLTIEQIIEVTSKAFGVPAESFMKKGRKKEIAFARQVAMYLSKDLTDYSTTVIGLHFGGRDHR